MYVLAIIPFSPVFWRKCSLNYVAFVLKLHFWWQIENPVTPLKRNIYPIRFVGNATLNKLCPNCIRFFFQIRLCCHMISMLLLFKFLLLKTNLLYEVILFIWLHTTPPLYEKKKNPQYLCLYINILRNHITPRTVYVVLLGYLLSVNPISVFF